MESRWGEISSFEVLRRIHSLVSPGGLQSWHSLAHGVGDCYPLCLCLKVASPCVSIFGMPLPVSQSD